MPPRTKRSQSRIAEQRIKELYGRFNNNKVTVQNLLSMGFLFFLQMKNKIKINLLRQIKILE
jgi:hypothetical protein